MPDDYPAWRYLLEVFLCTAALTIPIFLFMVLVHGLLTWIF
jgi:hypothetical protein